MARRPQAGMHRVTQSDVARAANVSTAIVSAVINNKTRAIRVSDQTRARVWQAIRDLGYVPNVAAQNLAGGRNKVIGAFTYHQLFPKEGTRDFYYEFLAGIEDEAENSGHNLLLFTGARNESGQRSIFGRNANKLRLADGAILVGGQIDGGEVRRLVEEKYPFVMIGRHEVAGPGVSWVAADYTAGTEAVVERLHALGHRRILMVIGRRTHETLVERRAGFAAACQRLRLGSRRAHMIAFGEQNPDHPRVPCVDGEEDVLAFAKQSGSTAIIAESSYVAHRTYHAALAQGISIPNDLSIIGLGDRGDQENVLAPDPVLAQLTTPRREIGAAVVRMLLRKLDRPEPSVEQEWMLCDIFTGNTLAPPSKAE